MNMLKEYKKLLCMILLLGFAAHCMMLIAPFKTLDDNISIVNNEDIKDFANLGKIFTKSYFSGKHYYRPMVSLSYMVEYELYGLRSFFYNFTNLFFHLLISLSVFILAHRIFKEKNIAFFTSLLFAVHPVQWEAVANIPGRSIILSTFFTINALLYYCVFKDDQKLKGTYWFSVALFTCGLLSKESAAMFPVLLLSYMLFIERNIKEWRRVIPYFVIIGIYVVIRHSLGITETFPWRSPHELFLGFLTFLRAALTYLRLIVWPVDLHFDRSRAVFTSFEDPQLLSTIALFLIAICAAIKYRKNFNREVSFFITWIAIELFPVSQIVTTIGVQPGVMSTAEHFLYMPVIGMFVLVVLAVRSLFKHIKGRKICSEKVIRMAVGGIFLFLMLTTVQKSLEAQSGFTMFQRSLQHNPNNARVQYSMGLEMAARERFREAEMHFRKSLSGNPTHEMSYVALGRALHDQGRYKEAIAVFESVRGIDGKLGELLKLNLNDARQELQNKEQR